MHTVADISSCITQNQHHCVAAATASSATGPFTAPSAPFICDDAGGGVIDISGFQAPDGDRYVVWKVDGSAINSNSTPIRLQRVQADGVTLDGEVYTLINRDASDGPLVEAPSLVYWDGYVASRCWVMISFWLLIPHCVPGGTIYSIRPTCIARRSMTSATLSPGTSQARIPKHRRRSCRRVTTG